VRPGVNGFQDEFAPINARQTMTCSSWNSGCDDGRLAAAASIENIDDRHLRLRAGFDRGAGPRAQLAGLRNAGCTALVKEKASGADRDRPELRHFLGRLRRGDTVVVVRIDRLARSRAHLLEVLDRMLGESHAENVRPIKEYVRRIRGRSGESGRAQLIENTRFGVRSIRKTDNPRNAGSVRSAC
jgi:hypothetical protein